MSRSWVSGRWAFMPCSSIAIALASAGPIQIGSTRAPSFSRRITTGVLVVRSRPRWATVTSIIVYSSLRFPRPSSPGTRTCSDVSVSIADAHALQLEPRDLLVHRGRQPVHRLAQRLACSLASSSAASA